MAIAVAPLQMGRADFRIDDQCRPNRACTHHVRCRLNAEGGRRTGHVHIECKAACAQQLLDFDGNRWIGPLHVGRSTDHQINVLCRFPRLCQRLEGCIHSHLGHERWFVIGPLPQQRVHDRGIQHTRFVDHMALFDPAGFQDELFRGIFLRLKFTRRNRHGMLGIVQIDIGVEGRHKLGIGDDIVRRENTGSCDRGRMHIGSPACRWLGRIYSPASPAGRGCDAAFLRLSQIPEGTK